LCKWAVEVGDHSAAEVTFSVGVCLKFPAGTIAEIVINYLTGRVMVFAVSATVFIELVVGVVVAVPVKVVQVDATHLPHPVTIRPGHQNIEKREENLKGNMRRAHPNPIDKHVQEKSDQRHDMSIHHEVFAPVISAFDPQVVDREEFFDVLSVVLVVDWYELAPECAIFEPFIFKEEQNVRRDRKWKCNRVDKDTSSPLDSFVNLFRLHKALRD
jgi:hypothetical protein